MLLGLTAINWIILIPATLCWPVVGVVLYLIWRSAKRHTTHDDAQREALLEAAARPSGAGPGLLEPRRGLVIGIALLTLVPGELGGSESATRELLRALARGGTLPYRVYLPPVAPDARRGAAARRSSTSTGLARSIPGRLAAMTLAAARPGPLRRRLAGSRRRALPADDPASRRSRRRRAVTLHDIQHLDLPQLFSRGERAFRSLAYHRSARSARIVIVPSAFVRDRAVEPLGLDPGRIRVIHHGIDHERFTPGDGPRSRSCSTRRGPGRTRTTRRLYEAFALLRQRPARAAARADRRRPLAARPPTASRRSGNVALDELVSLYRSAAALVFPSLYEGFGLPPLEAMACGCPVACSVAASLPEVCGDAARYFAPDDPEEIAAAVADVLADPDAVERARARAGGRVHLGALRAGARGRLPRAPGCPLGWDHVRDLRTAREGRGRPGARRGDERGDRPSRPRPRRGRVLRPLRRSATGACRSSTSQTGDQPIENESGAVAAVFNGEIYNFRELRRELEAKGHEIRGTGDSPLIPHAYEEWGLDFAAHLDGMFAIALWDRAAERLVLARDRLGKKPLALRAASPTARSPSPPRRRRCCGCRRCRASSTCSSSTRSWRSSTSPRSGLKAVEKVPPGSLVVAEGGAGARRALLAPAPGRRHRQRRRVGRARPRAR